MVFGALVALGVLIEAGKNGIRAEDILGLLIAGVLPIAGGISMIRSQMRAKQSARLAELKSLQTQREKEILQLARQKGGRLAVAEVAAGTSLSLDEAEQAMNEMAARGYVNTEMTDSGVIMYVFF